MLEALKEEVLRISRRAQESGLCRHGGGNFSRLDRERGLVAITPHAQNRDALRREDILVVDLEGGVVENAGGLAPSSETSMHLFVYAHRPDAAAVCHTHARNAAVFACLGLPVKPVLCEASMYGGVCRVTPFAPPGTHAVGEAAVEGLRGTCAVILGGHGLVTIGQSLEEAYLRTEYVEDVCDTVLRASALVGYDRLEGLSEAQLSRLTGGTGRP